MTSASTPLTGARKLNVVKTLVGHEPSFHYAEDGKRIEDLWGPAISYFPDGQKMISGYSDKTARLWDLQTGKEIEEPRALYEQKIWRVAVSRDSRWVIAGCDHGELKACEVKTGIVKTFKGHSSWITSIDISRDSKLLASGSWDGTTRIWDLEIGNLVASTSTRDVNAVRFSQDGRKLAVMSTGHLDVWDIEARKFDTNVQKNCHTSMTPLPLFWTTKDRTIVAVFSLDSHNDDQEMIYEIDSSTLEIVGAPFEGHTDYINSLDLSLDCALLVSAAYGGIINLWAFESRQILASFDGQGARNVALSPSAHQIAYTTFAPGRHKIYICDIPPDIIANLWPNQKAPGSNVRKISDPLNSDATARRAATQRNRVPAPFATRPLLCSPATNQQDPKFSVLRHLRKLLPASFPMDHIRTVEPRDPLDCPATSPRRRSHSSHVPIPNLIHSDPGENSRPTLPIPQSSTLASKSIISRLRHWRPVHTGHVLACTADVPLAQGQTRNAAAGAPKRDDSCVRDEDIDSRPPSPNSTSDRISAEEHRSSRLCFCF